MKKHFNGKVVHLNNTCSMCSDKAKLLFSEMWTSDLTPRKGLQLDAFTIGFVIVLLL